MSRSGQHADAVSVLAGWAAPSREQGALREAFLGLLAARPDATARSCEPGHLTASTVVLTADLRRVLLTLHPRLGRWVQLGGHLEDDDHQLAGAALREATEESGLTGLTVDPAPVHLDVHALTCSLGVPTRHFDIRYRVIVPVDAVPVASAESDDLRFFPVDDLPAGVDGSLRDALAAAVAWTR